MFVLLLVVSAFMIPIMREPTNRKRIGSIDSVLVGLGMLFLMIGTINPVLARSSEVPSYLPKNARETYREYLDRAPKKAFAFGADGSCGFGYGYKSMEAARQEALSQCRKRAENCVVIAEGQQIVRAESPFEKFSGESDEGISWTWFVVLLMTVFGGPLWYALRFRESQASFEDRNPIRSASLTIDGASGNPIQTIQRYAERQNWMKVKKTRRNMIVLESLPGLILNGYLFRVTVNSTGTKDHNIQIDTRPRVPFHFWHVYATSQTERLREELSRELDSLNDAPGEGTDDKAE